MAQQDTEIRYLNAPSIDTKKKKYCRLQRSRVPEEVPERAG